MNYWLLYPVVFEIHAKSCPCVTLSLSHSACIDVECIYIFALFWKKSPLGDTVHFSLLSIEALLFLFVCAVKTSWDSL